MVGRNIYDNILLVQEVIHSVQKRKEAVMAIKLDLSKYFDRIRHAFIFHVMEIYGFPPNFIRWIKACISSLCIDQLDNDRPTTFSQAQRGIFQGWLMFPFLYILVEYSLSRRLNILKSEGNVSGISFFIGVQPINHAQFFDDTIILGSASTQIARRIKITLDIFLKVSGSRINPSKAWLYGWKSNPCTLR